MNDQRPFDIGDRVMLAPNCVLGTIHSVGHDQATVVWDDGRRGHAPLGTLYHLRPLPYHQDPAELLHWVRTVGVYVR